MPRDIRWIMTNIRDKMDMMINDKSQVTKDRLSKTLDCTTSYLSDFITKMSSVKSIEKLINVYDENEKMNHGKELFWSLMRSRFIIRTGEEIFVGKKNK